LEQYGVNFFDKPEDLCRVIVLKKLGGVFLYFSLVYATQLVEFGLNTVGWDNEY